LSFIVAISPLLPFNNVSSYFVEQKYAWPASILSLILGLIISWLVFTFYSYLEWRIGTKKEGEYSVPRWRIGPTGIIWLFNALIVVLFILFFVTNNGLFQAVMYIVLFSIIIFVFSFLVSMTKARYEYISSKDNEAERIFGTLEKNRLISPGIAIYANEPITQEERQSLHIKNFGMLRKIRVETVVQEKEHIEVVLTDDCRQLIKVLRKRKV
jgi:hypothetical protein